MDFPNTYNAANCQEPNHDEHDLRQPFCIISDHTISLDATEELAADVQIEYCTNTDGAKKADNESLTWFLDLMNLLVHGENNRKSTQKQNQYTQWDEPIDGNNIVVCEFIPRCDCTKPYED